LLKGISHIFGGCKDPATELQSWFTEDPPSVSAVLETSKGDITVGRCKGLSISGDMYANIIKGKSAEPELDNLFGMDEESRAICTYRGQRKPGLFLSLSDEKKKTFLWNLLELGAYEKVANAAQEKAKKLEAELNTQSSQVDFCFSALVQGKESLNMAELALGAIQPFDAEALKTIKARIEGTRSDIEFKQTIVETTKSQSTIEADAVLEGNRSKVKRVLGVKEPVEVTGLKTNLELIRKALDEAKQKDSAARLQIEKQRGELLSSITFLKTTVANRIKIQKDLDTAWARQKTLSSQKCSECKREWVGSDAEAALATVKQNILGFQEALVDIQIKEEELAGQTLKLQEIKSPEVDPNIDALQKNLLAITEKIKKTTEAFETAKRSELNRLEQEEKKVKEEFAQKLALDLQEVTTKISKLQEALRSDLSEEQRLIGLKSQADIKKAVVNERSVLVESLEASHKAAIEKRDQTRKSLSLEKDIVALVGRQGFLGNIVEEILVEIAADANEILAQVANVRHLSVDFETERVAKTTGNVDAKITLAVYSRGRRVSFTSGISGGMQVALELALDLAVGDVVSRRRGSYPGWIILDESLDGLGGPDKESCLEMLQNHSGDRLILVVDHDASFQGLFNSVIEVEMTDGRSKIVV
jgi:DNA repair exonuclease SbcCD ATPase subunit